MTKQLRTEIERLWKRGEELKDHLIKMQKENARLRDALRIIRDELGDTPRDSERAYEIADAALKEKE